MAEPDYAIVDILCPFDQLTALRAIPTVELQTEPAVTAEPNSVLVTGLADEAGQTAAQALGCTVTVALSAEDYEDQIASAYASLDAPDPPDLIT